jgi:hypothetical protein
LSHVGVQRHPLRGAGCCVAPIWLYNGEEVALADLGKARVAGSDTDRGREVLIGPLSTRRICDCRNMVAGVCKRELQIARSNICDLVGVAGIISVDERNGSVVCRLYRYQPSGRIECVCGAEFACVGVSRYVARGWIGRRHGNQRAEFARGRSPHPSGIEIEQDFVAGIGLNEHLRGACRQRPGEGVGPTQPEPDVLTIPLAIIIPREVKIRPRGRMNEYVWLGEEKVAGGTVDVIPQKGVLSVRQSRAEFPST